MVTRLEITHGLIAEQDRLSTSADSLSVTRPTTGSKSRSKGVLFLLVGSTISAPRAREATLFVMETIRREYYYDESAGVPVCLEKAIKSADRRLRGSREGAGIPHGALGVAAAVVRNDELYLATIGAVEAYLVRSARLLRPERSAPAGLPAGDDLSIDVWRGELSMGDALLMLSRNVTETVGTEELKSAVLTLHPQAAVEHLHHLFVAAGGDGSDGLLALEVSEQTTHAAGRSKPSVAGDAYGDLSGVLSEPTGGAVSAALFGAHGSFGALLNNLAAGLWDAMPRRKIKARSLNSRMSGAEGRRRAAIGAMALIGVVFLLGAFVVFGPRGGDSSQLPRVAGVDSALSAALDRTERAEFLVATDEAAALGLYREAWAEVARARTTGLSEPELDALEDRVRAGLDGLYRAHTPVTRRIASLPPGSNPEGLVQGKLLGGAYYIDVDTGTVWRVNTKNGKPAEIVTDGDKPAAGGKASIGTPVQLAAGGPDVVIVDDDARLWRWRSSNNAGDGTLARLTLLGSATLGEDHGDVEAYTISAGEYRLYAVEPSRNQIMRYQQTLDGSAFQVPTSYLVTPDAAVADFAQLHVDFDVYALIDNNMRRYKFSRYDGGFQLAEPPDTADLRPSARYELVAGAGNGNSAGEGRVYLYDAANARIVGFDKLDGSYLGQWAPGPDDPQMTDVRGMYVIPGERTKKKKEPDTLVWISPEGIFESILVTS